MSLVYHGGGGNATAKPRPFRYFCLGVLSGYGRKLPTPSAGANDL